VYEGRQGEEEGRDGRKRKWEEQESGDRMKKGRDKR